jgi:hypothetical protein
MNLRTGNYTNRDLSNLLMPANVSYEVSEIEQMLLPHHLKALREERGINDEVIAARGYRSITDQQELLQYAFKSYQTNMVSREAPTILIPIHAPDGTVPYHLHRPDAPRMQKSKAKRNADGSIKEKVVKYETPEGMSLRGDRSPLCSESLKNPQVPLVITEGPIKGDAGVSHGLCVLSLPGVYGFKSKNKYGGNELLADFDHVPVNAGRKVIIIYDNDIWVNRQVQNAEERLTIHLQRKGAYVLSVRLPRANGQKIGLDDYLCAHSVQELMDLATGPHPAPQAASPHIELMDGPPDVMRKPNVIINGRSYVAIWPYVKITRHESIDKSGNIIRHNPPLQVKEQYLMIVRDDGVVFGEIGNNQGISPLTELGFDVVLPEIPPVDKIWSKSGINAYRMGERPDPIDIFHRLTDIVDRFIDFACSLASQRAMSMLIACYILTTWLSDAFTVIGFLWPNGDKGSGKTQVLNVVAELGYLGQVILAGGSFASLRDLADYGACLAFDDAENLSNKNTDPDKRTLLLAGNRKGNTVPLKEERNGKWVTRYVNTFCPRLFSATQLPDDVLESRSIVVPLIRTADRVRANSDVLEYSLWPHDRRTLIDSLWALALSCIRELPSYERRVNERAKLLGRDLEPWRAILAVAVWLEDKGMKDLYKRMEAISINYQEERQSLRSGDLTTLVIRALCHCASQAGCAGKSSGWVFTSEDIKSEVLNVADEIESAINRESITTIRVGRVISKLRLPESPRPGGKGRRRWKVTLHDLRRLTTTYSLALDDWKLPGRSPLSIFLSDAPDLTGSAGMSGTVAHTTNDDDSGQQQSPTADHYPTEICPGCSKEGEVTSSGLCLGCEELSHMYGLSAQ